tara:strand:- start:55 stop:741 length:687 start_codon:yes stop_codon:yes gene_type:complete
MINPWHMKIIFGSLMVFVLSIFAFANVEATTAVNSQGVEYTLQEFEVVDRGSYDVIVLRVSANGGDMDYDETKKAYLQHFKLVDEEERRYGPDGGECKGFSKDPSHKYKVLSFKKPTLTGDVCYSVKKEFNVFSVIFPVMTPVNPEQINSFYTVTEDPHYCGKIETPGEAERKEYACGELISYQEIAVINTATNTEEISVTNTEENESNTFSWIDELIKAIKSLFDFS